MERLTEYDYLAGVPTGDLKMGVDERRAFDRLAAYEDTGLEPEEIVKMGMAWEDSKRYSGRLELKLKAYQELGTIAHLRELVQAEAAQKGGSEK